MLIFAAIVLFSTKASYLRDECEQNGVVYAKVEKAFNESKILEESKLDYDMFAEELHYAHDEEMHKVVQKFCNKNRQWKTRLHKIFDIVGPCLGPRRHDAISITKSEVDQIFDYVCSDDGSPITNLIMNLGLPFSCKLKNEISKCAEGYMKDFMKQKTHSPTVALQLSEHLMQCVGQDLKTCDNSVKDFVEKILKIDLDGLNKMANKASSSFTVSSGFIGLVLLPVIHGYTQ